MLKTGTVPVSDQIQRVPAAPQDSESHSSGDKLPAHADELEQSRARHQLRHRRTTKRKSCGSCKPRWPCKKPRVAWRTNTVSAGYNEGMSADFWPGDRSRQGDCPKQMGKKTCFGESFRDWRWRTGGCIRDCEGFDGARGRQPAIQFPNHIERPTILLAPPCLPGRVENRMWRTA